ncbi:hypothetical protein KFV55_13360 (plasmid) [Staphylococcus epidermidis]|nr:hypothetical protein KFV55_13360 [Staphylococcus epidermidis]
MLGILIYLSFSNLGSEDNHKSHENSDKKRTDVKKNKKQSSSKDKNKSHENNDRSLKNNNEDTSNSHEYYDDPSLDKQVYEDIKESMTLLNSLTSQDIKEYKVNTQIYNQDKKPNVIITVDLKGKEDYSNSELKYRTEHISSNFTGRNEIEGGFNGYFDKLYIKFKEDGIDVGEAKVKFNDSLNPEVQIK